MISNTRMQDCIDNCHNVQETCLEAVNYCIENNETDVECIGMLVSTAEISATSAKLMMIESEFHPQVCRVCAEICQACAEYFEEEDDEVFTRVATFARACAESCRQMGNMNTRMGNRRPWESDFNQPWV
jgi:hypothetical protein